MGRSRRRQRRRNSPPFRAWGIALTVLAGVLWSQQMWGPMLLSLAALAFYLAVVRLARCRVETRSHRPCRWRVRGLLGTCDYHVGDKRGLPVLVRGNWFLGLPTFMWRRNNFATTASRTEAQPGPEARGTAATATKARRPGYDWVMMTVAGFSALVALAAFIRDLIAG